MTGTSALRRSVRPSQHVQQDRLLEVAAFARLGRHTYDQVHFTGGRHLDRYARIDVGYVEATLPAELLHVTADVFQVWCSMTLRGCEECVGGGLPVILAVEWNREGVQGVGVRVSLVDDRCRVRQ